ncbi:amidohydrolase family protein [Paenibacillus camerounensis]|uniref:amidohydrolase family protein n=1 Tax=Paenibacillus camerounensis TaxID=1243663 RepID=UPI00069433C9|nr:amidohydrolase family protein [Paenibacillus camerounensis]
MQSIGIGDRTGSIDAGKQADLIMLAQNRLETIRALADEAMVMVGGKQISPLPVKRFTEVGELLDKVWEQRLIPFKFG